MTSSVDRWLGCFAIAAPLLHSATDVLEWQQRGFSVAQLWLNYLAFLPMPAVMLGLCAAQRPRIGGAGLVGACGYGVAFIYFAHTTLFALETATQDYAQLWHRLGLLYTAHGALMVLGGALFGVASLRARVFPPWTAAVFLAGVALNAVLALSGAPEAWQPVASALRNLGLMGMGAWLLHGSFARTASA